MAILDLEAFGALGKSLPGVVTMVDGTFASPYIQQPIKYGIDFSIHSWYVHMSACSKVSNSGRSKICILYNYQSVP